MGNKTFEIRSKPRNEFRTIVTGTVNENEERSGFLELM